MDPPMPDAHRSDDTGLDPGVRRLTRRRTDRVLGGVAGGMADYFGVDAVLVRLIWVLLAFTAVGIPAYVVAWIVIPEGDGAATGRAPSGVTGEAMRLLFGGLLVAVGAWLLIDRVVPWFDKIALPAILIALGAGVLAYGWRR